MLNHKQLKKKYRKYAKTTLGVRFFDYDKFRVWLKENGYTTYVCPICGVTKPYDDVSNREMRYGRCFNCESARKSNKTDFKCPHCELHLKSKYQYLYHTIRHHKEYIGEAYKNFKPHRCVLCGNDTELVLSESKFLVEGKYSGQMFKAYHFNRFCNECLKMKESVRDRLLKMKLEQIREEDRRNRLKKYGLNDYTCSREMLEELVII